MISFNKIVNKLSKKRWKIIFKEDIFGMIDPDFSFKNESIVSKIIYKLKRSWLIISLKNWVYVIASEDDKNLNEIDLFEKYYYNFVKKTILKHVWNEYFISWRKALEMNIKDFSISEKIVIICRSLNKKIFFWKYVIIFKTINQNKINLYSKISKMTKKINVEWNDFKIANLELSLIQSAIIEENDIWIDVFLLKKVLKKYKNNFILDNFYYLWKFKYIMAFNRLKEISKLIDNNLYNVFLDIIKKNWGLFIWSNLRKI